MGAPLDVAAAFGTGPAGGSGGMVGMGPGPAQAPYAPPYTPAAGNMSMPSGPGAGIPQPPVRDDGGGKNKGVILAVAGVVGVASIIAIVFAVKGSGGAPVQPLPTGSFTNSDPMTVLSGAAVPTETAVPSSGGGELPPLNGGSSGVHPGSSGGGSGGVHPNPGGSSGSSSGGAKVEPPECAKARAEKAAGKPFQGDKLACEAKGGKM